LKRLVAGFIVVGVLTAASSIPTSLTHLGSSHAAVLASTTAAPTPDQIVQTAQQYLGSPYAYIGNTPAGFSCIGFVNFVFQQNGVYVPFDIPSAWNSEPHVDRSQLMPGDVLFFSNTVFAGLSHVAIYIGNDQMIGADSYSVGVTVDQVDDAYWVAHYTGATRPLALVGTAPQPGQEPAPTTTAVPIPTQSATENTPPAAAGSWVQPLLASVNLFSGPGYDYTPIASLTPANTLYVVQSQKGWYNVRTSSNVYGWVAAASIQLVPAPPTAGPTPVNLSVPSQAASQAAAITSGKASTYVYVAVGPLWVRSGPSKSTSPIGYVIPGSELAVYAALPHWDKVATPSGLLGWVANQYVSQTPILRSVARGAALTGVTARVTVAALHIRSLPDIHASIVTVLFSGETVLVIGQRPSWDEVRLHDGTVAWASAQYLSAK